MNRLQPRTPSQLEAICEELDTISGRLRELAVEARENKIDALPVWGCKGMRRAVSTLGVLSDSAARAIRNLKWRRERGC